MTKLTIWDALESSSKSSWHPNSGRYVIRLGMVWNYPGYGWWRSFRKWVTIFGKVGDFCKKLPKSIQNTYWQKTWLKLSWFSDQLHLQCIQIWNTSRGKRSKQIFYRIHLILFTWPTIRPFVLDWHLNILSCIIWGSDFRYIPHLYSIFWQGQPQPQL